MPTLEELLARQKSLHKELDGVNAAIDVFKVKCTGCRCYILPGRECGCCWDREIPSVEDSVEK